MNINNKCISPDKDNKAIRYSFLLINKKLLQKNKSIISNESNSFLLNHKRNDYLMFEASYKIFKTKSLVLCQ